MFNSFLKPAIIIPLISKKNPTMKNTLSKTDVSNAEEVRSVLKITKTHFMFRKKKKKSLLILLKDMILWEMNLYEIDSNLMRQLKKYIKKTQEKI